MVTLVCQSCEKTIEIDSSLFVLNKLPHDFQTIEEIFSQPISTLTQQFPHSTSSAPSVATQNLSLSNESNSTYSSTSVGSSSSNLSSSNAFPSIKSVLPSFLNFTSSNELSKSFSDDGSVTFGNSSSQSSITIGTRSSIDIPANSSDTGAVNNSSLNRQQFQRTLQTEIAPSSSSPSLNTFTPTIPTSNSTNTASISTTPTKSSPINSINSPLSQAQSSSSINLPQLTNNGPTSTSTSPLLVDPSLSRLFELSSISTGIDHPLCSECLSGHIHTTSNELGESERDNQTYLLLWNSLLIERQSHQQKEKEIKEQKKEVEDTSKSNNTNTIINSSQSNLLLQDFDISSSLSFSELQSEIDELEEEERQLNIELGKVLKQRDQFQKEFKVLEEETKNLETLQQLQWNSYLEYEFNEQCFRNAESRLRQSIEFFQKHLNQLQLTNIYNDTFHIWYDGHFGTINGFRLGRLPSQPVDWNEINAAWGQTALLLSTIAKRLEFRFSVYRIIPMGSSSKIEKKDDQTQYELFGTSDLAISRFFWFRRFDQGMVGFLCCLKELGEHSKKLDENFQFPYTIDKDKVGDMSIKLQFNSEETWTKALKYMLTDLKWLLAWMVRNSRI